MKHIKIAAKCRNGGWTVAMERDGMWIDIIPVLANRETAVRMMRDLVRRGRSDFLLPGVRGRNGNLKRR